MAILDVLFPKKCISCRKFGDYLCTNCFTQLSFDSSPFCLVCGNACIDGFTHPVCSGKFIIDGSFCGFSYKAISKKLIYSFKYKPYLSDLGSYLSSLLYESLIQQEAFIKIIQKGNVVFVPVPLSSKKLRVRGYNQAEFLADGLAKKFNFKVKKLLKRTLNTKPQFDLKKEERKQNIKGAFAFIGSEIPQTGLLVDDVLTTGSTLLEAANVLKRVGIKTVYGICFARDY